MKAGNIEEARKEAIQHSSLFPNMYFIVSACFGLYLMGKDNLWKNAYSDALYCCKYYYHNGKEKSFTEKQIVKSQDSFRD